MNMAATLTRGSPLSASRLSSLTQCRQEQTERCVGSHISHRRSPSCLGSLQVLAKKAALPKYQGLRQDGAPSALVLKALSGVKNVRHGRRETRAAAVANAQPATPEPIQVGAIANQKSLPLSKACQGLSEDMRGIQAMLLFKRKPCCALAVTA